MTDTDDITKKKANRVQTSMLVWVLMAMLVTGLGGFGVTNFGRSVTAIGSVGGQDIEVNAYARALKNQINALSKQAGKQVSLQEAKRFGVDQQVLSGLIANAALDNEAKRIGISVGNLTVARNVAAVKGFADLTGKFNRDSYKQALDQNGMTVKEFEGGMRADVARQLLQAAVVGGFVAPDALSTTLLAYSGEVRGLSVLEFSESGLPAKLPGASEEDLKAYYDANLAAFTRPEAKRISYAALVPADLAKSLKPDEAEVTKLYDQRAATYHIPEKRLVERLVFGSAAEAAAARARLDAGESFAALVTERGLALADIDLGDVGKAELGKAGDAVFALAGPGIVGPLPSDLGPALFRMNGILAAQDTTLAAAHDALALEVQTAAARKSIAEAAAAIDDALAGGATLEDLVKDHGMKLATFDYVAGADDNAAIAASRAFAAAADKVKTGDYPELVPLEDGGIIALRLDATVPPSPVPLDKAHDKVAAAFHAAALAKALKEQAEAAQKAVAAGASLGSQGVVTVISATKRDGTRSGTLPAALAAAFEMKPGEVRLVADAGWIGLVKLNSITPVDLASTESKAALAQLKTKAGQAIAQDAYTLYTSALTAEAGISMDQTAINSVQAQLR